LVSKLKKKLINTAEMIVKPRTSLEPPNKKSFVYPVSKNKENFSAQADKIAFSF